MSIDIQQTIRETAAYNRAYLEDLMGWENEMNAKEKSKQEAVKKEVSQPDYAVRNTVVLPAKTGSSVSVNPIEMLAQQEMEAEKLRLQKLRDQQKKDMMITPVGNTNQILIDVVTRGMPKAVPVKSAPVQPHSVIVDEEETPEAPVAAPSKPAPRAPVVIPVVPPTELPVRTVLDLERRLKACNNVEDKMTVIGKVGARNFRVFFKDSLEPELLVEILEAVKGALAEDKSKYMDDAKDIVKQLTTVNRVDFIGACLEDSEIDMVKSLCSETGACDSSAYGI